MTSVRSRRYVFAAIALLLSLAALALPHVAPQGGLRLATEGRTQHARGASTVDGDGSSGAIDLDLGDDGGDGARSTTTSPSKRDDGETGDNPDDDATTATTRKPTTTTTRPRQSGPSVDSVSFQFDAAHTGSHNDPELRDDIEKLWERDLNASASYPLIVGNRVFVAAAPYSGSMEAAKLLYAFDRRTGEDLWGPIALGGDEFTAGIAYDNGRLFAVNYNGVVRAFDPATGDKQWETTLPNGYGVTAAPTAKNGRVYVSSQPSAGSASVTLFALDEANGSIDWSKRLAGSGRSSAAVTDDGVYVSYGAGPHVTKLAPATGAVVWETGADAPGGGRAPVVYRGRVYARAADDMFSANLLVLDAATGGPVDGPKSLLAPAFANGIGLFTVNSAYILNAIDLESGDVLWTFESGSFGTNSAPVVVNGSVFVEELANDRLVRLDLTTGEVTWSAAKHSIDAYTGENSPQWMQRGIAEGRGTLVVPTGNGVAAYG